MLIFNQFHALLFKSNKDSVIVFFKMNSWLILMICKIKSLRLSIIMIFQEKEILEHKDAIGLEIKRSHVYFQFILKLWW